MLITPERQAAVLFAVATAAGEVVLGRIDAPAWAMFALMVGGLAGGCAVLRWPDAARRAVGDEWTGVWMAAAFAAFVMVGSLDLWISVYPLPGVLSDGPVVWLTSNGLHVPTAEEAAGQAVQAAAPRAEPTKPAPTPPEQPPPVERDSRDPVKPSGGLAGSVESGMKLTRDGERHVKLFQGYIDDGVALGKILRGLTEDNIPGGRAEAERFVFNVEGFTRSFLGGDWVLCVRKTTTRRNGDFAEHIRSVQAAVDAIRTLILPAIQQRYREGGTRVEASCP
jgi:hypothetical protein